MYLQSKLLINIILGFFIMTTIPFASSQEDDEREEIDERPRQRRRIEPENTLPNSIISITTYTEWSSILPEKACRWGRVEWESHYNHDNPVSGYSYKKYCFPQQDVSIGNQSFMQSLELKSKNSYSHYTKPAEQEWVNNCGEHVSYKQVDICLRNDDGKEIPLIQNFRLRHNFPHTMILEYTPIGELLFNNGIAMQNFRVTRNYILPGNQGTYPGEERDPQTLQLIGTHLKFRMDNGQSFQRVRFSYSTGNVIKVLYEDYELPTAYLHQTEQLRWDHNDNKLESTLVEEIYFISNGLFNSPNGKITVEKEKLGRVEKYKKLSSTPKKEGIIFFKDTLMTEQYLRPKLVHHEPDSIYTHSYYDK